MSIIGNPLILPSGGGGLEYETGTYTPTEDITNPTITFSNSHNGRPFFAAILDPSGSLRSDWDYLSFFIFSHVDFCGNGIVQSSSKTIYADYMYQYKSSDSISTTANNITSLTGTNNYSMPTFLSTTYFKPFASTGRYFRANRDYKWIAIWKT